MKRLLSLCELYEGGARSIEKGQFRALKAIIMSEKRSH